MTFYSSTQNKLFRKYLNQILSAETAEERAELFNKADKDYQNDILNGEDLKILAKICNKIN